ncbi:MAG: hypothetical protein LBJ64_08380 [Deltaproteobacteria bacterium]|jgi:hypothetical protein|nr:hypothetical protein [Deltaproteobacteria bacterium]
MEVYWNRLFEPRDFPEMTPCGFSVLILLVQPKPGRKRLRHSLFPQALNLALVDVELIDGPTFFGIMADDLFDATKPGEQMCSSENDGDQNENNNYFPGGVLFEHGYFRLRAGKVAEHRKMTRHLKEMRSVGDAKYAFNY